MTLGAVATLPRHAPATGGPAPFEVHVRSDREAVRLQPIGELDSAVTARLRAAVTRDVLPFRSSTP